MADCITYPLTISRIVKGVSISIYLYVLQLEEDILHIAKDDLLGRRLQDRASSNADATQKRKHGK